MTFSRGGKIFSGSTITGIATLAGLCLGLGEWDEELKISEEQKIRVRKVSNQLSEMGFTVLDNYSSNDDWDKVLRWYNSSRTTQEEIFKGSERKMETRGSLKSKCILALAEEPKENENPSLSLVRRWCVKEETITAILSKKGYTKIGLDTNNGNKQKWQAKIEKFKKLGTEKANIKLDIVENDNNDASINALIKICTELDVDNSKTNMDKDFATKFDQARDWCFTKPQIN